MFEASFEAVQSHWLLILLKIDGISAGKDNRKVDCIGNWKAALTQILSIFQRTSLKMNFQRINYPWRKNIVAMGRRA